MFQRPSAVAIAVLPPMLGVVWIVGLLALCGLRINGINTVLPTLTFAIGLTDSIHLMVDLQRRRAAGCARRDAAAATIRELALPSMLTAMTTAIGFGSLSLAYEHSIREFGIGCAVGIVLNFFAVIMVFPLLASTRLGDWVVPSIRHIERAAIRWDFSPLLRFVERFRKSIVATSLIATVVLLAISTRLRSEINMTEPIPTTSESATALGDASRAFGGGLYGYVVMEWPAGVGFNTPEVLETVAHVHKLVENQPEFAGAFSIRNLLSAAAKPNDSLHQQITKLNNVPRAELRRLVRADRRRLVVSFHIADIGGSALVPAISRLERTLDEIERKQPGFKFHVTGTFPAVARNLWNIISDLQWSLAGCTVLVFTVIALSLRSLRLSLISLLPDTLPLLVTSALLVLLDEPIRVVSMLTFSLCFGISVDDSIHFLTRFQRALRTNSLTDAVEETFRDTGAGIVIGTIIIVGAFSIMLLSSMPSIRSFALLCGLTMLTGLATMLLLLPALLLCFGPEQTGQETGSDPYGA
jgi:predicted RND superfamily exporter protein